MTDIFKNSEILQDWASTLDLGSGLGLVKPDGYGPYHGFNFVLNSFLPSRYSRSSKNFVLAITNENNPFEIYKQNFVIEPGFAYTFKIVANQIVTTDRFNALDKSVRNCNLPSETKNLNFTKVYSKSGCQYECAIRQAKEVCQCLPWFIPRMPDETLPFCNYEEQGEFAKELKSFSLTNVTLLKQFKSWICKIEGKVIS